MRTCDKCEHYYPPHPMHPNDGLCGVAQELSDLDRNEEDGFATYDVEGQGNSIRVGPKFGCIHWEKVCQVSTSPDNQSL